MKVNKRKIIRNLLIIVLAFLLIKFIMSFKQENIINTLTESQKLVSTEIVELTNNIVKIRPEVANISLTSNGNWPRILDETWKIGISNI